MPTIETKIDRFDGGISNDSRDQRENVCRVVSNFNTITNPRKMTPYRSSESGDDSPTTSIKRNFTIARRTGSTYSLYALGVVSGTGRAEVLYKDLTTGAATDLDDNAWAAPAANQSPAGAANFNLFVYYRRTGLIYISVANARIEFFSPTGTAWDGTGQAITHTHIGQGIVHSKDDILYIPYYDNAGPTSAIARNNNGTWNNTALTLPRHYIPTSICEYGNYLAIGCAHTNGIDNSRVFFWDRDATNALVSESIDWGDGSLIILDTVDGELVGVSQRGGVATSFSGLPVGSIGAGDKVIFRKLVGNQSVKFLELSADHAGGFNTTILPLYKQKIDNRLYFQMLIELNNAIRDGIWSIGRSAPEESLSLVHERTTNNDTALGTEDSLRGFIYLGNYLFQSYIDTNHATSKTNDVNDTSPYAHNSIYESKRFDGSIHGYDASYYKDLKEVTVTTEPMPASGQLTLAYRVNQNTAWTTIFTNSVDNSISHTARNIESSGAVLPNDYKEIQFRIVVTGGNASGTGTGQGVEVTSLSFKEEIKPRRYNAT